MYRSKYTQPLSANMYEITAPRYVPPHIKRPSYVDQDPQVFPNIMIDPIHVLNEEQIQGLKTAANLGARTLK